MDSIHTCAQSYSLLALRLAVFLTKLQYAVAYVSSFAGFPSSHKATADKSQRRRILVALRSQLFTFFVAIVRPAHNRAVCQRANSAVSRRTPKLYQIAAPGFKRGSWPERGNWHDMDAVGAGVGGGGAAENHDERLRRTAFRLSFGQILYFHSVRFDTSIRLNSEQPSFLRGDRPSGSQPDGMSKIKCPQFPTERCNYTKSPRLGSNAANNSGI